jgi:hypothetical protein
VHKWTDAAATTHVPSKTLGQRTWRYLKRPAEHERGTAMSFGIYLVGFLILIGGLIYAAVILHLAPQWIAVGAIVLLGLAIVKGVQATRGKDLPK